MKSKLPQRTSPHRTLPSIALDNTANHDLHVLFWNKPLSQWLTLSIDCPVCRQTVNMEPWQSWAVAIAGGGLAYYYYVHQNSKPKTRARNTSDVGSVSAAKTTVKPNDRTVRKNATQALPIEPASGDDQTVPKKRKAPREPRRPVVDFPPTSVVEDSKDEEANQAWAQQLADLRKGTQIAAGKAKDKAKQATRTIKQSASAAAEAAAATISPDTASQSSADATSGPENSTPARDAGDVNDMLESSNAPGPSVLRVTGSSQPPQAPRKPKEFEPALSKKQRQNRKKVEERQLAREADERERKVLLEKQRRTAREARGEPAKNGLAKPPTSSAWTGQSASVSTSAPSHAPLLDTFDQNKPSSAGARQDSMRDDDDAQLRAATQMSSDDSGWATVETKKKQRKTAPTSDGETSDHASTMTAQKSERIPVPAEKKNTVAHNSIYTDLVKQASMIDPGSHPDDSQWAV